MKLAGIFKKVTNRTSKVKVQAINKNQLAKVIGGAETISPLEPVDRRGVEKSQVE